MINITLPGLDAIYQSTITSAGDEKIINDFILGFTLWNG